MFIDPHTDVHTEAKWNNPSLSTWKQGKSDFSTYTNDLEKPEFLGKGSSIAANGVNLLQIVLDL